MLSHQTFVPDLFGVSNNAYDLRMHQNNIAKRNMLLVYTITT